MTDMLTVPGAGMQAHILLPDYRELPEEDRLQLCAHLLRLAPASRYLRFGIPTNDETIVRYSQSDHGSDPVICCAHIAGEVRAVAEVYMTSEGWPFSAELALSVEDDWQDAGLGTELMARALRTARSRHVSRLDMNYLPENHRMRRIAAKFGAHSTPRESGAGMITVYFEPLGPGYSPSFGSELRQ